MTGRGGCWPVLAVMALVLTPGASALEPAPDERRKLKQCERQLCDFVVKRDAARGDYACALGKTWSRSAIVDGVKQSAMSWTLGDARCKVDVSLERAAVLRALGDGKATLRPAPHTVTCEIERSGKLEPVKAVVEPRIDFEGGQAKKVWIGLKKLDGPGEVKTLVGTLAKLHDKVGLFHGSTVKSLNRFLHKRCVKLVAKRG